MPALANRLSAMFGLAGLQRELLSTGLILLVALLVSLVVLTIGGIMSYVERRVAGRVQSRVGPNRVGPLGLLQWVADGVKLITKEDLVPRDADRPLFLLAPYLVVIGVFAAFASIPFGALLIAADLNVGVVYLLAITSLTAVGILMAGWGSNNKWAMLGGVRSAAQIVAYEVPSTMALLSIVLLAGSLSLQTIIGQQGGWPWQWYIFHNPFSFVAFFLYFTAAIAEGNRTPFDLPEAESELVAGYNTEYSGMRFAGFFLGEFSNVFLMSAIATCLFFGGWQLPGVSVAAQSASIGLQALGLVVYVAKVCCGCFLVIWLRWTLPRLRVDQLTSLCYRYLLPLAFVCLLGNGAYLYLVTAGSTLDLAVHGVVTALAGAAGAFFVWRVFYHIRHTHDRISIDLARGERSVFDAGVQKRGYGALRKAGLAAAVAAAAAAKESP